MQLFDILEDAQLKSIIKEIINEDNATEVAGIYYNSQLCQANGLFVAINGEKTDGKKYIPNAIQNGANTIVCNGIDGVPIVDGVVYIVVSNPRLALAYIAHSYYNYPASHLKIIGITGTNGKTTTAHLVRNILEQADKKVGLIGTTGIFYNNTKIEATHTTPESLDLATILFEMLHKNVEYVVMEVSSHALVQYRVTGIDFEIAAFTNLTTEHLDYHKTLEEYAIAKQLLFSGLLPESIVVLNGDDEYAEFMVQKCETMRKIIITNTTTIKINSATNYIIQHVDIQKDSSNFVLVTPDDEYDISTQLTAYFNVQNAALSFAICHALGIDTGAIVTALSKCKGVSGRMESVAIANGATVYVDYAHTPDALEKVLIQLRKLLYNNMTKNTTDNKLICVFGCGGDRDKTKRPVMGAIANKYADIVCITDDNPRTEPSEVIISNIIQGITTKNNSILDDNVVVISNRSEAIKYAIDVSNEGDIILIAGKGHENYQIIGTKKSYFSDIDEINKNSM